MRACGRRGGPVQARRQRQAQAAAAGLQAAAAGLQAAAAGLQHRLGLQHLLLLLRLLLLLGRPLLLRGARLLLARLPWQGPLPGHLFTAHTTARSTGSHDRKTPRACVPFPTRCNIAVLNAIFLAN